MQPPSAQNGAVDLILVPSGIEHRVVRAAVSRGGSAAPAVQAIPLGPAALSAHLSQWLASDPTLKPGSRILLMGLAGALGERLQVGDGVLVELCAQLGGAGQIRWLPCDPALTAVLGATPAQLQRARLFTSAAVVCSRREKLQLHAQTGADVVDMEGFTALEMLTAAGHQLAIVRVVSDDRRHDLPDISGAVSSSGVLLTGPLLLALLKRPLPAVRLMLGSVRALRALAGLTHQLLGTASPSAA
ncbi:MULTISPECIES: hypothetical protein [Aphanothece]|uniref:phosphorylase family protein n=1 Tax=Aphanothece TaxID=1121 RepID=UPI0039850AEF